MGDDDGRSTAPASGNMTFAAMYARVSTEKQERQETIVSQLDALTRAAQEQGFDVPPDLVFVDDGYSGARLDRPGLDRLRDLAAEGMFSVVFVYSPDRLARNYAYQVVVLEELKRAGCKVVFINHPFDESPEQQMLLQIQGVFAEYERTLIRERTRRGRLFAARQGRINWGGNPPYGFDYMRKTDTAPQQLLTNEAEAEIVRKIYRWLIDEAMSSYSIARRLNELSVPRRSNNHRGWCQSTVIGILRNHIYKGETHYNRTLQVDARRPRMQNGWKDVRPGNMRGRMPRSREEWIPIRVPAIIDSETWDLAQTQLATNRDRSTRNNQQHAYLLRSLLVCGRCGRRMVGFWNVNGGRYICSARYPKHQPWSCDGRSIAANKVEPFVWAHVTKLLGDPNLT